MNERVTVLGLGLMGSALAGAFLAADHPTTVWNRSPGRAAQLVGRGAVEAASVAEAVSASRLVVLCLLDPAAARAVLDAAGEHLAGRTVLDLTTGTPDDARATAAEVTRRGARHLDGKILAVPPIIGTAEATLLYSGSATAHAKYAGPLSALGTGHYLGPDPGRAALFDLALLALMWSALGGFYHAAALLGADRIEAGELAPLAARWLSSIAGMLPAEAHEIDTGDYTTEVSTLALNATAIARLVEASRAQGIGTTVPDAVRVLIDRAVADGHGAQSLANVTELIKQGAS